jgi:hypothetical protein
MTDGFKPLLRTDCPRADESFWSYIIRLAELNDYPNCHWILNLAGNQNENDVSEPSIVFRGDFDLSILARLSGVEISKLISLTYPPEGKPDSQFKQWFAGSIIPRNLIRLSNPMICAACLRESNYCRRLWDLVPLTACPNHGCLLIHECPKCSNQITWARKRVSICRCGFDWREITQTTLKDTELEVARHLYNLCDLKLVKGMTFRRAICSPVLDLDLADFSTAVIFIAGQYSGEGAGTGMRVVSASRYSALHMILNKAFLVFTDWPNQFYQFLDGLIERHRADTLSPGIERVFGRFRNQLHRHLSSGVFDFMRIAYEEYLKCHWSGGPGSRSRFRKTSETGGRYITKTDAIFRLGLYGSTMDELISTGKLSYIIKKEGVRRLCLIEVSSLENVRHELPDSIPLSNAAKMLCISVNQVLALAEGGYLIPLRGPDIDGYRTWVFSRTSLEEMQSSSNRGLNNRVCGNNSTVSTPMACEN